VPFDPDAISPLQGLRVLDFTHVLAAPRSARTLAEYGAEVLHISSPLTQIRSASISVLMSERSAPTSICVTAMILRPRSGSLGRRTFSPTAIVQA
jgi:crotonobetainyl-CoA:carnitine CoA-transferase CaiB-like acyl-CoA transferase